MKTEGYQEEKRVLARLTATRVLTDEELLNVSGGGGVDLGRHFPPPLSGSCTQCVKGSKKGCCDIDVE